MMTIVMTLMMRWSLMMFYNRKDSDDDGYGEVDDCDDDDGD